MQTFVLEHFAHAREQMIVAAAISGQNASQKTKSLKIRMDLPKRGPHQRSDEDHVAATCRACKPQELPDLADMHPMVREALDSYALSRAAQRKQHDGPSPRRDSIGDRQRQASPSAQHRERA